MWIQWEMSGAYASGMLRQTNLGTIASTHQKHVPMPSSGGKHHLQGVWGAARPPSGEREGRSPLANAYTLSARGARGAEPARSHATTQL